MSDVKFSSKSITTQFIVFDGKANRVFADLKEALLFIDQFCDLFPESDLRLFKVKLYNQI